jgi:AraC-like DNA-binding protein
MNAIDDRLGWFRYLPVSPSERERGAYVLDAGYARVEPHSPYPPVRHPDDHHFDWDSGRTLPSHQIIYITRGGGRFESASAGRRTIRAGELFVLFPGEWHRYKPDPETGWDEHWVEIDGEFARRAMTTRRVTPRTPVVSAGFDDALLGLYRDICEAIAGQLPGYEAIIAAQAMEIAARLMAHSRRSDPEGSAAEDVVRRARLHILECADSAIDMPALAGELGMGYSVFRRRFRAIAGMAPAQYHLQCRIEKAARLLRRTKLPVGEIALQCGFESIFYFSRVFKRKTGAAPLRFRSAETDGRI